MRRIALVAAAAAAALQPVAAHAATKDFALQGYALPADKPVTIVLMRPDVNVGELQGGGLAQPNADWTEAARAQIEKALKAELASRNINFSLMEEQVTAKRAADAAALEACNAARAKALATAAAEAAAAAAPAPVATPASVAATAVPPAPPAAIPECTPVSPSADDVERSAADYRALHGAVVDAILSHAYNYGGGKLPTKKDAFNYTLGSGTGELGKASGANYGLFVMTNDQFASSSRKAMQVVGALGCLIGACVLVGGGIHVGYVSLVDLDTGNVVWFNVLRGSKGDVREEEGARTMVQAIMAGMPTRPGEMAAPAPTTKAK